MPSPHGLFACLLAAPFTLPVHLLGGSSGCWPRAFCLAKAIDLNQARIQAISCLDGMAKLEYLCLRQNFIEEINGIAGCPLLEHLDLRDNRIAKIENLDANTALE